MSTRVMIGAWAFAILIALATCRGDQAEQPSPVGTKLELQIESSAFEDEGTIPQPYTCDGTDISPPLSWSEPPAGTQSLALIMDDPDAPAGTWDHWLLYNIPPDIRSLPEGVPTDDDVAGVGTHGSNSWRRVGYGGPCPPKGSAHRYYFKLYALDATLDLDAGAGKKDVEKAMAGHILAQGQLMGRYGR